MMAKLRHQREWQQSSQGRCFKGRTSVTQFYQPGPMIFQNTPQHTLSGRRGVQAHEPVKGISYSNHYQGSNIFEAFPSNSPSVSTCLLNTQQEGYCLVRSLFGNPSGYREGSSGVHWSSHPTQMQVKEKPWVFSAQQTP